MQSRVHGDLGRMYKREENVCLCFAVQEKAEKSSLVLTFEIMLLIIPYHQILSRPNHHAKLENVSILSSEPMLPVPFPRLRERGGT